MNYINCDNRSGFINHKKTMFQIPFILEESETWFLWFIEGKLLPLQRYN